MAPGGEYKKSPYKEGSSRLLEEKTRRATTPSETFSHILPVSVRDWLLGKNVIWAVFLRV